MLENNIKACLFCTDPLKVTHDSSAERGQQGIARNS